MEEEVGSVTPADAKQGQARRSSGIATMFPFFQPQRQSMDTDDNAHSSDRPRKAGMGGKVKPGFGGGKHRPTGSGDLGTGEPTPAVSCNAADSSPSAAWAASSYHPPGAGEVTDTLSLSQLSPTPVSTGKSKGNGLFRGFSMKRRGSNKGSASPGVPSSPTLPGATPPTGLSFSASASSLSAGTNSQSPPDSLCRAAAGSSGAGASHNGAGSKLGLHSSSGDPDDGDFGSCYSDAMHSPSYQDGVCGGDTLDLSHGGYDMRTDASPMAAMRQELPEVFTPGFNQLLAQDCSVGREPDTPLDNTAMLEPTVALLSTAQLSQVVQMYDVQSMLLSSKAACAEEEASAVSTEAPASAAAATAADADAAPAAGSGSGGQTLLEIEEVTAAPADAAPQDVVVPAVQQQVAAAPVAAEDIQVDVVGEASPPAAAAAAVVQGEDAASPAAAPAAAEHTASPAVPAELDAVPEPATGVEGPCAEEITAEAAGTGEAAAAETRQEQQDSTDAVPEAAAQPAAAAADVAAASGPAAEEAPVSPAALKDTEVPADAAGAAEEQPAAVEPNSEAAACASTAPEAPAAAAVMAEQQDSAEAPTSTAAEGCSSSRGASPVAALRACSPVEQQQQSPHAAADVPAAAEVAADAPASAETADASTAAPAAVADLQESAVPHPAPGPQPEASSRSSSSQEQQLSSADVASHAINGINSELSLVEPSSTMVAPQASQQQLESSTAAAQPTPPAACHQPDAPAAQQELAQAPASAAPAEVDAAETAAAPAAEQEQEPAAAATEAPEQLQDAAAELVLPAECSDAALPLPAEEPSGFEAEAGDDEGGPPLVPDASGEPALPTADADDLLLPQEDEPGSPRIGSAAAQLLSSPVISSRPRSSARRSGRTPTSMVRESIPLFLSDPSRAVGGALMVEDSLDDQDMQQLAGATLTAAALAAAGGAAAAGRLLAHGGPQRVTAMGGFGGSQLNPLTPVAEGYVASPIPEETSTGGSSQSRSSSRYEAAAAGSPSTSPVRQLALSAQLGVSPRFGTTPGSVYSTPTLALGQVGGMGGGRAEMGATPASALSSAVGSAIHDIGSAGHMGARGRGLSPPMAPGMNVSPTLQLLPNLGATAGLAEGASGDGSTPSLLDARSASPSAVYNSLQYTTTPFRGALAALPIDAAVNAPLVDSSPFDLTDDGFDKCGLAEEAQRVAQNLAAAAAAGGFGTTPFPTRTPAPNMSRPLSPGGTGLRAQLVERMASPELTDGLKDMHNHMLIKQLTAAEKRVKELEGENMRLKEQVDIYEFEKTELNSQEEMEKQARLYAEAELQKAKMDNQALQKAKLDKEAEVAATKAKWQQLLEEATRAHSQEKEANAALQQQLAQMQDERNQALDRVNLLDMELTAVRGNTAGLQMALQKEQQHGADMESAVAAKDKDLADMTRINNELRGKLEKAMEQLIAAQTAKEHAREKAHEESSKAVQYYNECQQMGSERQQLLNERQQLLATVEKRTSDWQGLKAKYIQKSSTLKEVEARLAAKESEVQELMAMCDQLLQQQEARGG